MQHKINVVRRALDVNQPNPEDALDVLAKVGGFEIGGLAGAMLAAAANRIPIMVDGFISTAAAMIAASLAPAIRPYLIASHQSQEQGHRIMLEWLELSPLLDLDLRLVKAPVQHWASHWRMPPARRWMKWQPLQKPPWPKRNHPPKFSTIQ